MGNEWQTVQGPKSKIKNKANRGADKQTSDDRTPASGKGAAPSSNAVLAKIDDEWTTGRLANSKPAAASANGLGTFDQLEVCLILPEFLFRFQQSHVCVI